MPTQTQPETVVTHARIPKKLHRDLLRAARKENRTLSNYVATVLARHIEEQS